jgi:hypothetical protein
MLRCASFYSRRPRPDVTRVTLARNPWQIASCDLPYISAGAAPAKCDASEIELTGMGHDELRLHNHCADIG